MRQTGDATNRRVRSTLPAVSITQLIITVAADTFLGGFTGALIGYWLTRRSRRRMLARELLDWHRRISRAAQHGTVDVLATMAAMLRHVEHLSGRPAACASSGQPADRSRR